MRVRTDGGEIITLKYFVAHGAPFLLLRDLQHHVPNALVETEDGKLYRVYRLCLDRVSVLDLNPFSTV